MGAVVRLVVFAGVTAAREEDEEDIDRLPASMTVLDEAVLLELDEESVLNAGLPTCPAAAASSRGWTS